IGCAFAERQEESFELHASAENRALVGGKPSANGGDERFDVAQVRLDDVAYDTRVHGRIAVYQHVSKSDRGAQRVGGVGSDPVCAFQKCEEFMIRGRLAESIR
ncbi:MAG TPA: hypothetical protein VK524_25230, partial [Polyangiaceae bacterium]|nr:hypothetical protein [Polyangiaceae bacterium]